MGWSMGDAGMRLHYFTTTQCHMVRGWKWWDEELIACAEATSPRPWRERWKADEWGRGGEIAVVALVAAGKRAVKTAADTLEASQGQDKRRDTPQGRYQTWRKRLKYALRLRARGVEPSAAMSSGFFRHSLCLNRITRWPRPRGRTWELIITRCRAEVDAAGKAYHAAHRKQDEKLYELARDKSLEQGDAAIRMQRVWRALKESKASTALTKVWEEDVVPPADEPGREDCSRRQGVDFISSQFLPPRYDGARVVLPRGGGRQNG